MGRGPVLMFAICSKLERAPTFTVFRLIYLKFGPPYLVTKRGVPWSITLLNLFCMSTSSFFSYGFFATLFGIGANNCFFKSAILFYFSVITGA